MILRILFCCKLCSYDSSACILKVCGTRDQNFKNYIIFNFLKIKIPLPWNIYCNAIFVQDDNNIKLLYFNKGLQEMYL